MAKLEGDVDVQKVIQMCLMHDVAEIRSGDHNWVHKKYVKIFEEEIKNDQMSGEFLADLKDVLDEYDERKSKEAVVAKDAELIDQILLLREYSWQGNKEADIWLTGKGEKFDEYRKVRELKTESAKKLGTLLYDTSPSEWWNNSYSNNNR